jgi:hypothetical protein
LTQGSKITKKDIEATNWVDFSYRFEGNTETECGKLRAGDGNTGERMPINFKRLKSNSNELEGQPAVTGAPKLSTPAYRKDGFPGAC